MASTLAAALLFVTGAAAAKSGIAARAWEFTRHSVVSVFSTTPAPKPAERPVSQIAPVPAPRDVKDGRTLERLYLELWEDVKPGRGFTQPGRQILHCTFGSTLTDPTLSAAIRKVLEANKATFTEVLTEHFVKHLEALNRGL